MNGLSLIPHDGLPRREVLRIGGISSAGFLMNDLLRCSLPARERPARARNMILVWLDGGPSHLETFDLKPEAPSEVRGPLSPIASSVAGIHFSECLPQVAALFDQFAVIRSMTSPLGLSLIHI